MAGNDLPDIMLIPGANASGAAQVQSLTQFLPAKAADLTPVPGRRRGQGLPEPGGDPDLRLEELRLRAQRQAVHAADRALLPGQHAAEELGRLRPGARQGLRPQERRRLQTRPPAAHQAQRRTSGASAAYQNQMYYIYLLRGDVRRAQQLGARFQRQAHQGHRDAAVQGGDRLRPRPGRRGPVPPGCADHCRQHACARRPSSARSSCSTWRPSATPGRMPGRAARS